MVNLLKTLRGRRPLFTMGIALNATVISLAMSTLGATPAAAAKLVTETVWIPLHCNIGAINGGPAVHLASALTVSHPKHLHPGESFGLTGVKPVIVLPPLSQQLSARTFAADATEGVLYDFEQLLTNANGNFTPGGTGTQVNTVAAMQPPNGDAPPVGSATVSQTSPRDPLVDPNTANPSPLAAWTNGNFAPVAPGDPRRHNVFSFGPIPISTTATANEYGPAPGTGGGLLVTSGTPDPINVFPFTVTGAGGQNVVIDVGDASRTVSHNDYPDPGPLVALTGVFYHNTAGNVWVGAGGGNPYPVYCGTDNSPARVAKPDPTMVDRIVIPIDCDVNCQPYGNASVIKSLSGIGSDASLVATAGAIVVVLSTLVLVALRRRRVGRL